MQSHKLIKYKGNGYNPGQSKAELLTWSSITIGKLPPPPRSLNYLELFSILYDAVRGY